VAGITAQAPAKVNLALHVTGKRADGYHLLDSLVVFCGAGDSLTASPAPDLALAVTGPFATAAGPDGDNLVLAAARGLARLCGVTAGAHLTLIKNLPVGAGLGGGSADAAAALRLLCRLWRVAPSADALAGLALTLGADVPVCLAGTPCRMEGIGERLSPLPPLPPGLALVLVNPGLPVATPSVFKALAGRFGPALPPLPPQGFRDGPGLAAYLRACRNDLLAPAEAICPPIGQVLAALTAQPGLLATGLSGSGATCWGLAPSLAAAADAADQLKSARRAWWVTAGALTVPGTPS